MKMSTKRKMYRRRRKKEKAEQRRNVKQSMLLENTANNCNKYNRKQYKLNLTNNNFHERNGSFNPINLYSQGLQLWWQTYCSAIEFHTKQQNAWHVDSRENQLMLFEKYANEYETSSEEEDVDVKETSSNEMSFGHENKNYAVEECFNEDYMKFLEITHKHQEELRLMRAEDNC